MKKFSPALVNSMFGLEVDGDSWVHVRHADTKDRQILVAHPVADPDEGNNDWQVMVMDESTQPLVHLVFKDEESAIIAMGVLIKADYIL